MTKRIAAAAFAAALAVFALAGCASNPTPTDVARQTLDAIKAQDFNKLQSYYSGDTSAMSMMELAGSISGMDLSSLSGSQQEVVQTLVDVMTSFDYELGEEAINGDTATVEATFTTYDLGAAFSETMGEYFATAFASALSGEEVDEEAMTEQFATLFSEKVGQQTEKSHVASTTLGLSQVDGQWKIDTLSEEATDAIMGGMMSSLDGIVEGLAGLGSADSPEDAAA